MMMSNRIAQATFYRDDNSARARIPAEVKDYFKARPGDRLIFERGCLSAVELAALKGSYLVVRLERTSEESEIVRVDDVVISQQQQQVEPFIECVRRKLNGE
jgi:bifunctional DNA-binding transcriptional regulator/antitoxin component of YhaV-PrlF toxin-antitoxin module